jgi:hypothetical protein
MRLKRAPVAALGLIELDSWTSPSLTGYVNFGRGKSYYVIIGANQHTVCKCRSSNRLAQRLEFRRIGCCLPQKASVTTMSQQEIVAVQRRTKY